MSHMADARGRLFTRRRANRGHALVMAVVFVFFLTLFGLAFYRFAETDVDLTANDRSATGALYAAQAGIEKVSWIMKNHRSMETGASLSRLNPFASGFYSDEGPILDDFQLVAHDNQAVLSPGGGTWDPYFRINWVDARGATGTAANLMACSRIQVLGALDLDGDGQAGLSGGATDLQGFPIDSDDINRKYDVVIGLPADLGKNLSAGAPVFTYGSSQTAIDFTNNYERLRTQDGYEIPQASGFWYFQRTSLAEWDQYGFIFGKPVKQGNIVFPPNLFDDLDKPQRSYFAGLDVREFSGSAAFSAVNDPTSGDEGRDIIFVDGDVEIRGVDFGHLDSSGTVRGCDWERTDVTIIASGTLTVKEVRCDNVGRLTLIAQNIVLVGDYDTWINGLAVAGDTITLNDQESTGDPDRGCPYGILKHGASEPIRYTAYFIGTLVAGGQIHLENSGWTVLFDERVINGQMYDPTYTRPTHLYEDAEDPAFDLDWRLQGGELLTCQEAYSAEEITDGVAMSWDGGGDDIPNVMRIYQLPGWKDRNGFLPDRHDYGFQDGVELDFPAAQDWSHYRAFTFWMSLDNWKKVSGSSETSRIFYVKVRVGKSAIGDPHFSLNEDSGYYDTSEDPGDGAWKRVRIPFGDVDPSEGFDIENVAMIRFILSDFELSWYRGGVRQWVKYRSGGSTYGEQGAFYFYDGTNEHPVRFWKTNDGRYRLYYTTAGDPHETLLDPESDINDVWIDWNPDPADPATMVPLYFEDQFDPNLRIDQIQLPGRPDNNTYLEYGLTRSLHYGVTHLSEYKTF